MLKVKSLGLTALPIHHHLDQGFDCWVMGFHLSVWLFPMNENNRKRITNNREVVIIDLFGN
jgi:hypothetical protein